MPYDEGPFRNWSAVAWPSGSPALLALYQSSWSEHWPQPLPNAITASVIWCDPADLPPPEYMPPAAVVWTMAVYAGGALFAGPWTCLPFYGPTTAQTYSTSCDLYVIRTVPDYLATTCCGPPVDAKPAVFALTAAFGSTGPYASLSIDAFEVTGTLGGSTWTKRFIAGDKCEVFNYNDGSESSFHQLRFVMGPTDPCP